ncbi:hypothetical protein JAO73_02680 [Hymenobacter sp. BT523]|uniref:hypothetical protein n=1 Tax=Hymenobacter sp. BT523 TaxID=2795725 RepID=UPI0018EAED68|nr:hypothetical protein [Hymenobacter sp. BT523]MBJ6107901.1 hypothetical protein [Hymenobacter sp. BT523]
MPKILLSLIFTVLVSVAAYATPPSVVVIQTTGLNDHITVTRGAGKTEVVKPTSALDPNKHARIEQFQALLAGLYAEGYTIQSTTVANMAAPGSYVTTYVLVKP